MPSRWTLRPIGKVTTRLPVGDQHDAGFEIEGHELLQNTGHGEHRQSLSMSVSVFSTSCPWTVVPQRPGLQHGGQADLRHGGTQRRFIVRGGVFGRRQPAGTGVVLFAQASCESYNGRKPCGMLYLFSSGISTLPGTFSNS